MLVSAHNINNESPDRRKQTNTVAPIKAGNVNKPSRNATVRIESGKGKCPPPTVNDIGDIDQTKINRDGTISTSVTNHSAMVPLTIPPRIAIGIRNWRRRSSTFFPGSEPGEYGFTNDRLDDVF